MAYPHAALTLVLLLACGFGSLASDLDGDAIPDAYDNCSALPTLDQCDADRDGYGNPCDGDFDQNGSVNSHDFAIQWIPDFRAARDSGIGSDMNCDGRVNAVDFTTHFVRAFQGAPEPGPSGLPCAGDPPCDEYAYVPATGPGGFTMGEDSFPCGAVYGPAHTVVLTTPFVMRRTELTRAEWRRVMDPLSPPTDCEACPIQLSWWSFAEFANAISPEGDECYALTGCSGTLAARRCTGLEVCPDGPDGACGVPGPGSSFHPKDCVGYRIPTEAEWEYAARSVDAEGRTTTTYTHAGDTKACIGFNYKDALLDRLAWYNMSILDDPPPPRNAPYGPQPVGLKQPNRFSIFDMLGNVNEWVFDRSPAPYPTATQVDPLPGLPVPPSCDFAVDRGGRWDYPVRELRSAYRSAGVTCEPLFTARIVRSIRE